MNGFELSKTYYNWAFANPDKSKPIHAAIYFFAIDLCNRLGWKPIFGFPTDTVMEATGIKSYKTYKKALNELSDFGFIEIVEESKNQYTANLIALVFFTKAYDKAHIKALDKAITKQLLDQILKQYQGIDQSTIQSIVQSTASINKPITINNKPITKNKNKKEEILKEIEEEELENTIIIYAKDLTPYLSREAFLEETGMYSHKNPKIEDLRKLIPEFINGIKDNPETSFRPIGKHKSHFKNWCKKQLEHQESVENSSNLNIDEILENQ